MTDQVGYDTGWWRAAVDEARAAPPATGWKPSGVILDCALCGVALADMADPRTIEHDCSTGQVRLDGALQPTGTDLLARCVAARRDARDMLRVITALVARLGTVELTERDLLDAESLMLVTEPTVAGRRWATRPKPPVPGAGR